MLFLYLLEVRGIRHRHILELQHSDIANLLVNLRTVLLLCRLINASLSVDKVLLIVEGHYDHLHVNRLGLFLLREELRHVLLKLLGLVELVVHGIDLGQEALLLLCGVHASLRCKLLPRLLLTGV